MQKIQPVFYWRIFLGILRLGGFLWGKKIPQASYRPILRLHGRIHYLIASGTKARVSASGVDVFLEKASTWTGPHMHLAITVAHFSNSQKAQWFSEGFFSNMPKNFFMHWPKDHWTPQWKGLNLHSRGWVLKTASFEGSGYLGWLYFEFWIQTSRPRKQHNNPIRRKRTSYCTVLPGRSWTASRKGKVSHCANLRKNGSSLTHDGSIGTGIFAYIYPKFKPNVGKYTYQSHGSVMG